MCALCVLCVLWCVRVCGVVCVVQGEDLEDLEVGGRSKWVTGARGKVSDDVGSKLSNCLTSSDQSCRV